MNQPRILSFEMSQKINDSEIELVSGSEGLCTLHVGFDSVTGKSVITSD